MQRYPKAHGRVNEHRGVNLYKRALAILAHREDEMYFDSRYERLIQRLPALYARCRANEGY